MASVRRGEIRIIVWQVLSFWFAWLQTASIGATSLASGGEALIVKPSWVFAQQKQQSPIVLVDVRAAADYLSAHADHAVNLPSALSFNDGKHQTRVAPIAKVARLLSRLGLKNGDSIVLYDNGRLKDAAHVFWMLKVYGHQQVYVLEGGLPAWKQQGGGVSHKPFSLPASQYVPTLISNFLATKLATRLAVGNPHVSLIDSRNAGEFTGNTSQGPRAGHIPGAINIPASTNLATHDGLEELLPVAELRRLYQQIDPADKVITYCNRGKDSALSFLILMSLGYDVSVYDGAWPEWSAETGLPIAPKE